MISSVIANIAAKLIITEADEQLKYPRLQDEQTIETEIIDEIDSTRNDIAERLEAVLLVSEVCRTVNGGIEGMNIKAEAIGPIAKNIDEIAVLDTLKTAMDDVSSTESNSKIDKKVDKLTTKLDGQTVTKMSEKVDISIAKSTQTRTGELKPLRRPRTSKKAP